MGVGWALAESCSGGLLAARMTDLEGASAYFAGGVVAYANEAKAELLGVDPRPDRGQGRGLAGGRRGDGDRGAGALRRRRRRLGHGIAGPDGGSEEKPVGYVCFNARLADGTGIARDPVIPGGRADVRERSALVGMHLLRMLLGEEEGTK